MADATHCLQCGKPLTGKRQGALYCKDRCRKRFGRHQEKLAETGYAPPLSRTSAIYESRADQRFRAALAGEGIRAQPLTDDERELLARQRLNPGVLLPELQARLIEVDAERRLELAETYDDRPLKVEDRFTNPDSTVVARRAIQSRRINKPVDPNAYILRPSQSGPSHYPGDLPECIDAPWSRGRW